MDASRAPSMAPQDEWEPFREEIGERYRAGTLKSVKEYMEITYRFPEYSLSTWKKKIRNWGFDNKYNKASTIVDVAAHFDQCPGQSSLGAYTLPSGKEVSLNELQRYLRRRKQVYANGALVSMTNANVAASCTARRSQRRPIQEANPRSEAVTKRRARQRQLILRRLYAAFLFGQGFVRPAELMAPKSVQSTTTFLAAIERCLVCSWEQNMWAVNDDGYLMTTTLSFNVNGGIEMMGQFSAAKQFHRKGEIYKARVLLYQGILSFQSSLAGCLPHALRDFLYVFMRMIRDSTPEFVRLITKWCDDFLGKAESAYIGLRSLFGALSEMHPEDSLPLVSQAWKVWSRSLEGFDARLAYHATAGRMDSIRDDQSLDKEAKVDALTDVLHDLETGSKGGLDEIVYCIEELSRAYFDTMQIGKAEKAVERGLRLIEKACNTNLKPGSSGSRHVLSGRDLKLRRADFLRSLAQLKDSQGDIAGACQIMEEIVELYDSIGVVKVGSLKYLADLQQDLGDKQAFLTATQNYDRAIEGLMTMRLNKTHLGEGDEELESVGERDSNEGSSEYGDDMQLDSRVDADVERQFHNYMNGRPHDDGKRDGRFSEWQEGVEPSVKQDLMLTVSDVEDLEGL